MISPRDDMPADLIQKLLSAAHRRGPKPASDDATDYPFDRPNRFTRVQLERLDRFAARAAESAAARVGQALQAPASLVAGRWQQCFAGHLRQALPASLAQVAVIVGQDGKPAGWIGISNACASRWLACLLGGFQSPEPADPQADPEAEGEPRELSDLERDLLVDVAAGVIEALQEPVASFGAGSLGKAGGLSTFGSACEADGVEEMCLLEFSAEAEGPACVALLIPAATAAALAGETASAAVEAGVPPMMAHVERTPIEARAMLSGSAPMRDIIALTPGDVLVLDQRVDDAVDVEVDGRVVMRCHPVRSGGNVALRFAELVETRK